MKGLSVHENGHPSWWAESLSELATSDIIFEPTFSAFFAPSGENRSGRCSGR